jgi:ribonuclease BN (tRNA processing enzyme)
MSLNVRFVGSGDSFGSGGRAQTCMLVDGAGMRVCLDFGTTSLMALAQQGIHHNTVDAIVLTHFHADHCGGVPFLLMDAMLSAKRTAPLVIAGPRDTRRRIEELQETLFPGSRVMVPRFTLRYLDLDVGHPVRIGEATVTAVPARHTAETAPTSVRMELGQRTVAYTGDGEWTDEMRAIGNEADLVIAECYYFAKPVKWHLNYPAITAHAGEWNAGRVILTHMSAEMLEHEVPEDRAWDGRIVEV